MRSRVMEIIFMVKGSSPWNSLDQNSGVNSLSLLQWIFPTQGSKPGLPHCRWILYQLSFQGSPVKGNKLYFDQFSAILSCSQFRFSASSSAIPSFNGQ